MDKPCKLISDADKEIFDAYNSEFIKIIGTPVRMWSLNKTSEYINPVYREPQERIQFDGPYEFMAFVTKPEWIFEGTERGVGEEVDAVMTLSRKVLEDGNIPEPKIGDVFNFWGDQYFDVIKAVKDGFLNDTATYTQWIVDLKRRYEYLPEKKEIK